MQKQSVSKNNNKKAEKISNIEKKVLAIIFFVMYKLRRTHDGGVAQLVRAPACHAGGREFEPRHSRH